MNKYYYADASQRTVGPLTLDELRNLARAGTITGSTPVIEHGASQWKTWADVDAAHPQQAPPSPLAAEAVARQVSERFQASMSQIAWGAMFYGILLVVLQFLLLPATVLRSALLELSDWGKAGRLPSSISEFPVLTFLVVVLRPFAIILYLIVSLIWLLFVSFGPGLSYGYGYTSGMQEAVGARIFLFVVGTIVIYFYICVVALTFDLLSLGIRIANNVKKLADKA